MYFPLCQYRILQKIQKVAKSFNSRVFSKKGKNVLTNQKTGAIILDVADDVTFPFRKCGSAGIGRQARLRI